MPLMVGGPMGRGPAHNFGMGMLPGPAPPPGPPATGGPGGPGHYVPVGHSGGAGGGGKTQQQARQELLRQNNDYSQNFVDTGQRPQNYLRDSHLTDRWVVWSKRRCGRDYAWISTWSGRLWQAVCAAGLHARPYMSAGAVTAFEHGDI